MKGFFSREEIEQDFEIQQLEDPLPACKKCGMHVGCMHPKTEYTGDGRKKCLIVAEAMGPDEDEVGKQLVGQVGQWFRDSLSDYDLDLDRDFWKINAVNCFPHDKDRHVRSPTRAEVECCRPLVEKAIRETNPEFIWIFGNSALESFFMKDFSRLKITRWRNTCIPDQKYNAWILPMFHPSYITRNPNDDNLLACFDWDLKYAVSCLNKERPPVIKPREHVVCLTDPVDVVTQLEDILSREPGFVVIDYETSGLKPQAPGHKIATVAIMEEGSSAAYSFPFQYSDHFNVPERLVIKSSMRQILRHKKIGKVAHNMKFEHAWGEKIFGVSTENWKWDTMLCAHILDTRKGFSGLKFQSYVNFGIRPYDKHIKQYLKDTGSGFNKIDNAPLDSLLLYGGMDVVLTRMLYRKQLDQFTLTEGLNERNKLAKAYRFFHEGNLALADVQRNGIPMDEEYYAEKDMELADKIDDLYEKLAESKEAEQFKEEFGREINLKGKSSQKDLTKLLTEVLDLEMERTLKNNIVTDEKALTRLNIPFTNQLLKLRKLEKIHGTYFAEFKREMCDGRMFPFFDLVIPRSLRSSSSKPNFQNIPNREEEAKKLCRSGIIPSKGNQILESDFKGIEVSIAACYTQDPTLVEHVTDPNNDMHRDCAADVWLLDTDQVTSEIRFYAKNCWVFPQFYGSYFGNCAEDLWESVIEQDLKAANGEFVADHIQDQGIDSLDTFKEHCQDVERVFWNSRFQVYKQWKDRIQREFRKRGYFETYFGFRFHGYLTYNQLCNYPIQGTAFHCLLWTLIELQDWVKREKLRSRIIGQIHDSIVWDLNPEERDTVIEKTIQYGTVDIVSAHPWINVPLEIDFEITPVDGSWYEKEEMQV